MSARGFALNAATAPEVVAACAREAEELGYGSFWLNHGGPNDGIAGLASAAEQTTRLELGVGVVPLHTRGPESIVDGVGAARLPLDRLLLGVGSPNPNSLARVREGVAELRTRLDCTIVVAALGPKMCRLAGEVADGVLFNWLTPDHARASAELVGEGAALAGRPVPRLITYVRLATGPDARERLVEEGARYASSAQYGANFERMGAKPVDTAIAADTPDAVEAALARWADTGVEVALRALPAGSTLEEHLELLRLGAPR